MPGSTGNYLTGGTTVAVAVTNASTVLLAAEGTPGDRRGLYLSVPAANTGTLFCNLGSTAPTSTLYDFKITPGGQAVDVSQVPAQCQILGILSVAGPENINVGRKT